MVSAIVEGEGSTVARFLERSAKVGAFSYKEGFDFNTYKRELKQD